MGRGRDKRLAVFTAEGAAVGTVGGYGPIAEAFQPGLGCKGAQGGLIGQGQRLGVPGRQREPDLHHCAGAAVHRDAAARQQHIPLQGIPPHRHKAEAVGRAEGCAQIIPAAVIIRVAVCLGGVLLRGPVPGQHTAVGQTLQRLLRRIGGGGIGVVHRLQTCGRPYVHFGGAGRGRLLSTRQLGAVLTAGGQLAQDIVVVRRRRGRRVGVGHRHNAPDVCGVRHRQKGGGHCGTGQHSRRAERPRQARMLPQLHDCTPSAKLIKRTLSRTKRFSIRFPASV